MSERQPFFDKNSLATLLSFEGKTLKRVGCHLFINFSDQSSPIQVIDRLLLSFTDGQTLAIGADEDGECLTVNHSLIEEGRPEIPEAYSEKIKVVTVDASTTSMWKDALMLELKNVKLTKTDGNYRADALVLDFGDEKREISVSPVDGIIIDFYET